MAYYKVIGGVKYDKEVLELGESLIKDKVVNATVARALWASALDGNQVTDIEKQSIHYIFKENKPDAEAKLILKLTADMVGDAAKGAYKTIDGTKYERSLLKEAIAEATKGKGKISMDGMQRLWASALDGPGVTETEARTVQFVVDNYPLTEDAVKFGKDKLSRSASVADSKKPEKTDATKDTPMASAEDDDLPDFDEDDADRADDVVKEEPGDNVKKGNYAAIHSSGFRDFLLKPELIRAIVDCGFEHPSEVQHECIPQAILGTDILCQAKSGMGKTAVFVLACLQQLDASEKAVKVLVICHTRELAYQIKHEFDRFAKYFTEVKTGVVYGGIPIAQDRDMLKSDCPHVLIGTPGRVLGLVREKDLKLEKCTQFVLDECDKCLDKLDMRKDVQQIFIETPKKKQVMMFSATMTADSRALCKKFMHDPHEIRVDEESKLTLHGLLQYYVKLSEREKNRKLNDLLDALEFNQVVIFVKSVQRAIALDKLLIECNFPSIAIHSGLNQEDRIARYKQFKEFQKRIMVSTDLFGRGIDIERVNIVINYDMPDDSDSYLHRVGRAGRFGTKGLAITFVGTEEDADVLKKVQERFEVNIDSMPASIDTTSYLNA